MVYYKTHDEIEYIRQSSLLVSKTLAETAKLIRPGIKTIELDRFAGEFIKENGGIAAFLGYRNFPNSLCISVNEEVVHGIPGNYELKEGDIVSLDCGVLMNGYYGDSAFTFPVGEVSEEKKKLMHVTRKSLELAVDQARIGKRIGDIAHTVQEFVERNGFSVVRELVGHGLGKKLHEDPEVPNYGKRGSGLKLQEGLVIAIEPMVNMGKKDVMQAEDGWTIYAEDKKPSAHFEHTIAITSNGPDVLTTFEMIDEVVYGTVA